MSRLLWICLLVGCATATSEDTAPAPADTADSVDSSPDCAVPTGITFTGEFIPGQTIAFAIESDGDPGEVTWAVSGADDPGTISADGAWVIPEGIADRFSEDLTVSATACGTTVALDVDVDWPEAYRVVVVYNPAAEGSLEVAEAYATFRNVPADQLCAIETTTSDTLAGADYPAFLDAVVACTSAHTFYVVPVWGVPYKVSDRVKDLAYESVVTVSLDALLFGGPESVNISKVDYNPAYIDGDSASGEYDPYKPWAKLVVKAGGWIVTRIDGASSADAIALVDRTREAEEAVADGTLDGIVYVDGNRGETPPADVVDFGSYEWGEWNMWGTRRVFEGVGAYDVVWDGNAEEFGTAPAPLTCPDALYYAGWYSFWNYNDCFDWTVGAIGAHLDSCSACDIRNPGTWSGSALLDGITATFGAVNEPYVAGMPEYDQFFYDLLQGANFGEAAYESTVVSYWMMVWIGDPLYRPYGEAPLIPLE